MSSEGIRREVAWRLFAHEYNDSDMSFKEGDDERAPNYVVTPTGAKVNRLFVIGVVTEVDEVGDDYYRVRISDPTATYMVYAGQYQPDAVSFFRDLDTPEFVSVVGKARTYQPDDGDDVYTSIRPEEVNTADEEIRDRWNLEAARHTIDRAEAMIAYLKGDGRAYESHRPRLHDADETAEHYDLTEDYLEDLRREAYQVVAELAGVDADIDDLEEVEAEPEAGDAEPAGEAASETGSASAAAADEGPEEADADAAAEAEASEPSEEAAGETEPSAGSASEPEPASAAAEEPSTDEAADQPVEETRTEATRAADQGDSADAEAADRSESTEADASFEEEFDDVDSEEAEWEWDEGERERVEEEFGGEFDTAAEIEGSGADTTEGAGEPAEPSTGEAEEPASPDVGAAEPETEEAPGAAEQAASGDGDDLTAAESGELEGDEEILPEDDEEVHEEPTQEEPMEDEPSAEAGDGDVDAEAVVMEVIEEHGDGEGVERPEIKSLAAERGVDEEAAEEALEQLLLEGMCYPSDGDRIKPL